MKTLHIVKIQADLGSVGDQSLHREAEAAYSQCLGFLRQHGELLGDIPLGGGIFLVPHEALIRFFAGCRTHPAVIQISVFSLQESDRQLVPPTVEEDQLHKAARFCVPKA